MCVLEKIKVRGHLVMSIIHLVNLISMPFLDISLMFDICTVKKRLKN